MVFKHIPVDIIKNKFWNFSKESVLRYIIIGNVLKNYFMNLSVSLLFCHWSSLGLFSSSPICFGLQVACLTSAEDITSILVLHQKLSLEYCKFPTFPLALWLNINSPGGVLWYGRGVGWCSCLIFEESVLFIAIYICCLMFRLLCVLVWSFHNPNNNKFLKYYQSIYFENLVKLFSTYKPLETSCITCLLVFFFSCFVQINRTSL